MYKVNNKLKKNSLSMPIISYGEGVKRFFLLFTFCFLLFTNLVAQSVEWEKTYGWDFSEVMESVIKVGDNYYAAGKTSAGGSSVIPLTLIKLNRKGDTVFIKPNFNFDVWTHDLAQSADGNIFMLSSHLVNFNYDRTLVAKLDTNGNTIWAKDYNIGGYDEDIIVALPDGGAIFMGATGAAGISPYAVRIDSLGNEVWNYSFPNAGSLHPRHLYQMNNGRFMLSGYQHLGTRKNMFYLIFDENGNQIKIDTITTGILDGDYAGAAISQTMNGDFLITSHHWTGSDSAYLFRMDSNFNYKWHVVRDSYNLGFFQPYEMLDGNIVVGGGKNFLKLDANGNVLSDLYIFSSLFTRPVNLSCVAYDNKGSAVFGGSISFLNANSDDFYFTKIDSIGIPVPANYGCNPPTIQSIQNDFGANLSNIILSNTSTENIQYSDILVSNWYFQDGTTLFGDTIYKVIPAACPTPFWAMLVVTDGVGCTDTLTIDVCTGQILPNPEWPIINAISSPLVRARVRCYPNPTTGKFTVELNSFLVHGFLVKVYDIFGEVVDFSFVEMTKGGRETTINFSSQPNGIYIIEITTDEYVYREKVVKE